MESILVLLLIYGLVYLASAVWQSGGNTDILTKSSRAKIIALCGDTRFKKQILEQQKRLTLEGNVVISDVFGHSCDDKVCEPDVKEIQSQPNLQKIDMADEIFVINIDGYIGEITQREIDYATRLSKLVRYLEHNK